MGCFLASFQAQRDQVINTRSEEQEQEVARIPPSIEHRAGNDKHRVLATETVAKNEPVRSEHDREEDREVDRVEEHARVPYQGPFGTYRIGWWWIGVAARAE